MADEFNTAGVNPPKKWVTSVMKAASILSIVGGAAFTSIGVMAIANPNAPEHDHLRENGTSVTAVGGLGVGVGVTMLTAGIIGSRLANYAGIMRKATNADKVLLNRADVNQKIEEVRSF